MRFTLKRGAYAAILLSLLAAGAAGAAPTQYAASSAKAAASGPNVDWASFGNTANNNHYSSLTQINSANVNQLGVAWTAQEGPGLLGWETDPLVVKGVMYFTTQLDQVRAVDATTGKLLWQYTPKVDFSVSIAGGGGGVAENRGVTVANDRVYLLTFDNQLISLQASTGEVLWRTVLENPSLGYSESAPATYWNGLLFVGSQEGDAGLRGFVAAYNANTGKQVWRWYTVPAPGHGWMPKVGQHGGGDVWMPSTIDPTTGILYFGTGNPSPDEDNSQRPGCNPWADAMVALNAKTGKFIWAHTEVCNDVWDYDSMPPPFIFNMTYHGHTVHAVGHANKSGLFFVYDAATGKVLAQSPHLSYYNEPHPKPAPKPVLVCPGAEGGVEYSPEAYDPTRQLAYLAGLNECDMYQLQPTAQTNLHKTGLPDFGGPFYAVTSGPHAKTSGFMAAVDVTTGKVRWKTQLPAESIGGTLATAGNLVFTSDNDGYFYAFDSSTGKVVWKGHVGLAGGAAPMTYEVNGVQYIAVALGTGFLPGTGGGTLAVFKLGGQPIKPFPAVTLVTGTGAKPSIKGLIKINPWEYANQETQRLVIDVTAGATSANSGFNFDGYAKGNANFIVPAGWDVSIIFTNKSALQHNVAIATSIKTSPPAVIPSVLGPQETLPELGTATGSPPEYINFQATQIGKNYLVCTVPGHLQAGMWIYFTESTTAHVPSIEASK
ncbi:MAG TPA: PQQ-binding-like beta-propeller repeat protein [Chloroflexota bacterium]|nr:PQQ-binding-like beta-propeller repeat protein [Chloroflexota bacterium]